MPLCHYSVSMQAQTISPDLTSSSRAVSIDLDAAAALPAEDLSQYNDLFGYLNAQARVDLALHNFPGVHVLSSSFGAQAAVSLHMLTEAAPNIPVILLDTGYLFPETYQFVEQLSDRLHLNLHIYRNPLSPDEQEVRYGRRWLNGTEGIEAYNLDNKVKPMQRALRELNVGTWFTGIRRSQSLSRVNTPFVQHQSGQLKVAPIADWSDRDVYQYLNKHDLPYHPLWHQGYVSIGDTHTTKSLHEVDDPSEVRFFGLKRECGLHG